MSFRAILAPASGSEEDRMVFGKAARLAAMQGGRLKVLCAFPPPASQLAYVAAPGFYLDPRVVDEMQATHNSMKEAVNVAAAVAGQEAGLEFGRDVVIEVRDCPAWEATLASLPLTDIVVIGPNAARGELAGDLLLNGRAPVLIAHQDLDLQSLNVAVAWDGGLHAGRAVRAALPLLRGASRIVAIQQLAGLPPHRQATADLSALRAYLGLWGLTVDFEEIAAEGDTGELLLEAARGCRADLMVCGAYGHSRARELVFGGVTRTVISAGWSSVLLAH